MIRNRGLTVMGAMRAAFPRGYVDHDLYEARLADLAANRKPSAARHQTFQRPPASAVDLFAVVGHLLLRSGAYQRVVPLVTGGTPGDPLEISAADRSGWRRLGEEWRGAGGATLPEPPSALKVLWTELISAAREPVFRSTGHVGVSPKWWRPAVALFCIADEAALDLGFHVAGVKSAQAEYIEAPIRLRSSKATGRGPWTMSAADPDQLCVLPKSRTARVGCTLRSLSHNLALLPGRGLARAHWSLSPSSAPPMSGGDPAPFNLVVLPSPFDIRANAFRGTPSPEGDWGWFDVEPHWCPASGSGVGSAGLPRFLEFVEGVLEQASRDCGEVHALVLPEIALGFDVFRALADRLKARSGFEMLVSGLFDAPAPAGGGIRHGNFAAMARFSHARGVSAYDLSIREKHHRWQVDGSQIETYALGSALDARRTWWERIDLLSRSLDVFVLRGGATVTTLICEDLARNDPCQELVRGIGPNFVVALLMDGPQRRDRWPARYATVLADDPGSSVLSVTSMGLIRRTNRSRRYDHADQIGLFRDDTGATTEIRMPEGCQAVTLTLQPTVLTEWTLDGRPDKGDAQSWRLTGMQPVRLVSPDPDVMDGLWPDVS